MHNTDWLWSAFVQKVCSSSKYAYNEYIMTGNSQKLFQFLWDDSSMN